MELAVVPQLADLVADPGKVVEVRVEAVPSLRGELARLDSLLLMRLLSTHNGGSSPASNDRLLSVKEASEKLSLSEDYLYRNANKLPFTVRVGKRKVRFSEAGIQQYIKNRAGRRKQMAIFNHDRL